ncbi:MAG: recombination protein NinG [Treponemataceae bacterium]|nr:MAG: recombination protein NinG [Treponemataceae bacterium]
MKSERSRLIARIDKVFSEYIRRRDFSVLPYVKCPTCGKLMQYEESDAGHFINRRAMNTRWNELNVWAQCRACNRFAEGKQYEYGLWLERKIGKAEVEKLLTLSKMQAGFDIPRLEYELEIWKKKLKDVEK